MATFATLADMAAAGYTRGNDVKHRGFIIRPVDTSGAGNFGYSFAIGIAADWRLHSAGAAFRGCEPHQELTERTFGASISVWLTDEKNQVNMPGCFAVRFAPEVWAGGVEQGKAAIDEWLARNPRARAAVEAYESERAAIAARQDAKVVQRQAIRMARRDAGRGSLA